MMINLYLTVYFILNELHKHNTINKSKNIYNKINLKQYTKIHTNIKVFWD